jgi:hypothetical protein
MPWSEHSTTRYALGGITATRAARRRTSATSYSRRQGAQSRLVEPCGACRKAGRWSGPFRSLPLIAGSTIVTWSAATTAHCLSDRLTRCDDAGAVLVTVARGHLAFALATVAPTLSGNATATIAGETELFGGAHIVSIWIVTVAVSRARHRWQIG